MTWLADYGLFIAKFASIFIIVFIFIISIMTAASKLKADANEKLEVKPLNKRFKNMADTLNSEIMDKSLFKLLLKQEQKDNKAADKKKQAELKKQAKLAKKAKKSSTEATEKNDQEEKQDLAELSDKEEDKKRVFVINFDGDVKASEVDFLREEITSILSVANTNDEVVLRLESPGGMVHSYGLAASQLARFREKNIPLTVCVDKVAASGGYMMACVANKIVAAPFAVIGSIGVVAQIPNFHRKLKKNDIDFEQFTAGDYKRTVTMFGENTKQDREKMQQDINEIHELFKDFIHDYRPDLDVAKVATGETWYGKRAKELNLIDAIQTSDDYLMDATEDAEVFEISYEVKKSLKDKIPFLMAKLFNTKDELLSSNKFDYFR